MKSTIHIDNIFLEDEKNIQPKINLNTSTNLKYFLFIIYTTFVINIYNLPEDIIKYILIIYPIISYILNFYDTRLPILDNMLNGFYNMVCLFITPYYTYSRKQIIENPSLLSLPRSKYLHYCKSCKRNPRKYLQNIVKQGIRVLGKTIKRKIEENKSGPLLNGRIYQEGNRCLKKM